MDADLELVQRLQAGEDEALNELIQLHQEALFRFTYRYLQNEQDSRDITQESFVRVYFNRHKFKPQATFRTWLFTIALNLCRDHARKMGRNRVVSLNDTEENDSFVIQAAIEPGPNPANECIGKEDMERLHQAIQELPHDFKTALILFALEGCSQAECAEILSCSIKTVEMRVYRARKILSEKLSIKQKTRVKNAAS